MTTLTNLATRIAEWNTARRARAALTAALYGDYQPGHRLTNRTLRKDHCERLAIIAAAWADAYLTATPNADVILLTPIDRWLGELIAARAGRTEVFTKLITDLPEREIEYRLTALLRMAANARLERDERDDPEPAWP